MDVFLSWSGERSKRTAELLRDWLPTVLQCIVPWVSSEDIDKGDRWSAQLAERLAQDSFGIICVTPECQGAQWLNFEAGALSKVLGSARVTPLLIDMRPIDLVGPLAQFQATQATQDDMLRLVRTLNNQQDAAPIDSVRLEKTFHRWWPDFETDLKQITNSEVETSPQRTEQSLLEEILERMRRQERPEPALNARRFLGGSSIKAAWMKVVEQGFKGELRLSRENVVVAAEQGKSDTGVDQLSALVDLEVIVQRSDRNFEIFWPDEF